MTKKPGKPPKAASDIDALKELIQLLESSSVSSLKIKKGDVTYEVSRLGMPPVGFAAPLPAPAASTPSTPSTPSAAGAASAASNLIDIKSPMVGTFYRAPEPGADPYVKAGSRVAPGQTLCIIEAMKIMNEIESEVSGRVREVLIEDAQPVEFGQVLFRVEPNA